MYLAAAETEAPNMYVYGMYPDTWLYSRYFQEVENREHGPGHLRASSSKLNGSSSPLSSLDGFKLEEHGWAAPITPFEWTLSMHRV